MLLLIFCQPERGTKRKKEGKNDNQTSNDSKKRQIDADIPTGSGLSEEERMKILEMVENEPEVISMMKNKLFVGFCAAFRLSSMPSCTVNFPSLEGLLF